MLEEKEKDVDEAIRYECLELAYRYVMKGYEITISELAILCRVRLQDRYTDIINFINGKIKKD